MPSLRNIQEFGRELKQVGDEPEILKKRGEALPEEPAPPREESIDSTETEEPESGVPPDIDALLAGLGEEEPFEEGAQEAPPGEGGEEPPEAGAESPPEDSFLEDFLRQSDEAEETELTSLFEEKPSEQEGLAEEGEAPAGELPAEELPDEALFFDVPSAEELTPPAEGGEALPEPPGGDLGDLGDLGGLGAESLFGEEGAPEPETPTAEPAPPVEQGDFSDFELPELDEEDFGAMPPSLEEGAEIESPEGEISEVGIPAPDEPLEISSEDFLGPEEADLGAFEEPEMPAEEAIGEEPFPEMPPDEAAGAEEPFGFEEMMEPGLEAPGESAEREEASSAASAAPTPDEGLGDLGLDDIGEQFGLTGGESEGLSEEELNPALAVGGAPPPAAAPRAPEPSAPLRLSDRQFQSLRRTLSELPRNLRINVEELIGERELGGAQLNELIGLLVDGASPRQIADAVGRIIGRRVEIPLSYERKTGREFEEERGTFSYRFRHNILPILRVFLAGAAVLALLVFLIFRFVYSPIHAYSIYAAGYHQLENDNFMQANDEFTSASRIWPIKNWYYRYADGYIAKHQYAFAAAKYDALLSLWPGDRKAIFDYSAMESKVLGNYAKAETLLNVLLNKNMYDFQGLLQSGDNYLRWGAEDKSKYEKARIAFATLLDHYGPNNTVLFRMLQYFIRTDNYKQVIILKDRFQADKKLTVDPAAYAELGGYLIGKNNLSDVRDILFRAMAVKRDLPEIHFNLARYFNTIGSYGQEAVALQNALTYLQESPLTKARLGMLIQTYDMIGVNYYRQKKYLDAEQAYSRGIDRYETAIKQNQLAPQARFGKIYADLGDLNYYVSGNFNQALRLYQQAAQNDYTTPELLYKEGYVYYRNQDYKNALLKFYAAAGNFSTNQDLIYATANTLFKRNDFFAAEGYYDNLLNSLEQKRAAITDFQPNVKEDDHALLVNLMTSYNNLGVTLNQLSKRSSDASKYSQSLVNLTRSMEAFDQLTRDPVTQISPPSVNLAFVNMRNILYPVPNYELQIYADLPRDMTVKSF